MCKLNNVTVVSIYVNGSNVILLGPEELNE